MLHGWMIGASHKSKPWYLSLRKSTCISPHVIQMQSKMFLNLVDPILSNSPLLMQLCQEDVGCILQWVGSVTEASSHNRI